MEQRLDALYGSTFRIGAYTLGYTRDIGVFRYVETGIGLNFTAYMLRRCSPTVLTMAGIRWAAIFLFDFASGLRREGLLDVEEIHQFYTCWDLNLDNRVCRRCAYFIWRETAAIL